MKTYMAKAADAETADDSASRSWHLVDGKDQVLGRLAAKLARVLQGKHKPQYTPHIDVGDFVVVTNVERVRVTGKKAQSKSYAYYTGYMGGHREIPYTELMERDPARVLRLAVRRMLPKTKLGRRMLGKLKVYTGDSHPHTAQQPAELDLSKI